MLAPESHLTLGAPYIPLPLCLPSLQLQQVNAEDSLEALLDTCPPPRLSPYPALLCPLLLSIQLQQVKAEDSLEASLGFPLFSEGEDMIPSD